MLKMRALFAQGRVGMEEDLPSIDSLASQTQAGSHHVLVTAVGLPGCMNPAAVKHGYHRLDSSRNCLLL